MFSRKESRMAVATFQPDSPCLRFCDCEKSLLGLTWQQPLLLLELV